MVKNSVKANTFTSFDATLLTNNYQVCDPGLPRASFTLRIVNTCHQAVKISYDGITDHDVVLGLSENQLPLSFNSCVSSNIAVLPVGSPVYLAYTLGVPKSGYIYVISYYQP